MHKIINILKHKITTQSRFNLALSLLMHLLLTANIIRHFVKCEMLNSIHQNILCVFKNIETCSNCVVLL